MTNTLAADVDTMGQWRQLLVLLSGSFVVTLDFFIVNVRCPRSRLTLMHGPRPPPMWQVPLHRAISS